MVSPRRTSRLFADWQRLAAQGLTNRAIAARLAVSEAELVASGCGRGCTRLEADGARLFQAARDIGELKVVVRNDYAVMERTGAVRDVRIDRALLDIAGTTFRLVIDTNRLGSMFALNERRPHGIKRSLLLYDLSGASIVKLVMKENSDVDAYERLCGLLRHAEQTAYRPDEAPRQAVSARLDRTVPASLAGFLASVAALGEPLGITIRNDAARLEVAAALQHIKRSERAPWINVLDPALDLHLAEAQIALLALENDGEDRVMHWVSSEGHEAITIAIRQDLDLRFSGQLSGAAAGKGAGLELFSVESALGPFYDRERAGVIASSTRS